MHLRWVMTFLVCGMTLILRRRLLRSNTLRSTVV